MIVDDSTPGVCELDDVSECARVLTELWAKHVEEFHKKHPNIWEWYQNREGA